MSAWHYYFNRSGFPPRPAMMKLTALSIWFYEGNISDLLHQGGLIFMCCTVGHKGDFLACMNYYKKCLSL